MIDDKLLALGDKAFALGVLTLFAVTIVVLIWQVFATTRARASAAREEAYRELAGKTTAAIESTSSDLREMLEGLTELRARVAEIERILREVQ